MGSRVGVIVYCHARAHAQQGRRLVSDGVGVVVRGDEPGCRTVKRSVLGALV
jgi:hypothetical protein